MARQRVQGSAGGDESAGDGDDSTEQGGHGAVIPDGHGGHRVVDPAPGLEKTGEGAKQGEGPKQGETPQTGAQRGGERTSLGNRKGTRIMFNAMQRGPAGEVIPPGERTVTAEEATEYVKAGVATIL